jgi:hypothetical protein
MSARPEWHVLCSDVPPSAPEQARGDELDIAEAEARAALPKGYKGDPSDTREDAYWRMQVLLLSVELARMLTRC